VSEHILSGQKLSDDDRKALVSTAREALKKMEK